MSGLISQMLIMIPLPNQLTLTTWTEVLTKAVRCDRRFIGWFAAICTGFQYAPHIFWIGWEVCRSKLRQKIIQLLPIYSRALLLRGKVLFFYQRPLLLQNNSMNLSCTSWYNPPQAVRSDENAAQSTTAVPYPRSCLQKYRTF